MALKDKLMTLEDFKAVRDVDVASNSAQFTEIKADLGAQTGIISKIKGYYVNLTTDPVNLTPVASTSSTFACAVVDCTAGDKFIVNGRGASLGRAWGFVDSANHVLSMADANATVEDLELTAPTNAVKLVLNDGDGGMSYKVGNNLATKAANGLSDDIKSALLACFDYVAWKGTNGNSPYDALYTALYPGAYPTVKWDKNIGRLPSTDDGIATYNNSENIFASFDAQNGIHIDNNNSALDSQYIIYAPTNFNTCKKGVFEVSINIVSIANSGGIDVRLSDGTEGLRAIIRPDKTIVVHDGSTSVVIQGVELNTGVTYNIKYEFEQNGTNRIYINNTLVYEGDEVSTSYTSANRFFMVGNTNCYIRSMKWTIKEV